MSWGRKLFLFYLLIYIVASALFCHYYAPSSQLVTITGTEVKRTDDEGPISAINPANGKTRDVYYIATRSEKNKVAMYRNEDTGWQFPWYFKFNSADVQAQAQSIIESKKTALLVSYGWRINIFSMFKNIVKIKPVTDFSASTLSMYTLHKAAFWVTWFLLIVTQLIFAIKFSKRWDKRRLSLRS